MPFASDNIVPNRIYIDTGAFQAIADCGGYVFGEDPMPQVEDYKPNAVPKVVRRPDGALTLDCLRKIFAFDHRAHFDWVVSPASLTEIDAARDASRSRYAREILAHTQACLMDNPPSGAAVVASKMVEGPTFGNISAKDRKLLIDATAAECDVFLTIEKRLPRQAHVILKEIPLLVATPMTLWEKLKPHLPGL